MKLFLQIFLRYVAVAFTVYMLTMGVIAFGTWDPSWIYIDAEFFEAMRWLIGVVFLGSLVEFFSKSKDNDNE